MPYHDRITPVALIIHVPVAQLDRALACGAKGRRFESCRVHQNMNSTKRGVFICLFLVILLNQARFFDRFCII